MKRNYYVKDPKAINEQECVDSGVKILRSGEYDEVTVHVHGHGDPGCISPETSLPEGKINPDHRYCYSVVLPTDGSDKIIRVPVIPTSTQCITTGGTK